MSLGSVTQNCTGFLPGSSFSGSLKDCLSSVLSVTVGIPRGLEIFSFFFLNFFFDPFLFSLYIASRGNVIDANGLNYSLDLNDS